MHARGLVTATLATAMVALVAGPGFAAGRLFFASGCTTVVPTTPGGVFRFYGILEPSPNPEFTSPIPLDWENEQHTMVIDGELTSVFEGSGGRRLLFANVSIQIYTDVGPATPADFAAPSTFQDGSLILASAAVPFFEYFDLASPIIRSEIIPWGGGVRLSEMLSRMNQQDFVEGLLSTLAVPAGYEECWDLRVGNYDFPVEGRDWSAVKALYRD